MATREEIFAKFAAVTNEEAKKGITPAHSDDGKGNPNPDPRPDAGLHSSVATPGVEAGKVTPHTDAIDQQHILDARRRGKDKERLGQRTEPEIDKLIEDIPDGASITLKSPKGSPHIYFREGGKFYLESQRNAKRKTDQTYRVRNRLQIQTCMIEAVIPVALAVSPESVMTDAAEKEKNERMLAVSDAKTPEELCDIVASFDTVPSVALGDTPGGKLASHMRKLLAGLSSRFDTYEAFEEAWKKQYTGVTRAYGVQEKFDVLLKEKMRLKFLESVTVAPVVGEKKNEANIEQPLPGSEKSEEKKDKAKKKQQTPEEIEIARIESEMKELYHTMIDEKSGKVIESGKLVDARKAYVEADYKNSHVWRRIWEKFPFVEKKTTDDVPEKAQYDKAKLDLLNLKLRKLRLQTNLDSAQLKEAMAETLQLSALESSVNVYNDWTEVRGEGKIERAGKMYNELVRKHPWMSAGIGLGLLAAGVASGGAAPTVLTAMVLMRRVAAGTGLMVTTDSAIGGAAAWIRERNIKKTAGKKSGEFLEHVDHKESIDHMEKYLKECLRESDNDFSRRKIGGKIQKSVALVIGASIGGFGYAAQWYREMFPVDLPGVDGKAVVGSMTLPDGAGTGRTPGEIIEQTIRDGAETKPGISPIEGAQASANPPVADAPAAVTEAPVTAGAEAPASAEMAPSSDVSEAIAREKFIEEFVNQDIKVVKGDSVWKISGRLADQLNLEGAERTHFIDSLKDKFGDVRLTEGQTINMAEKGIDKEFIENALGKSDLLTSAQIESINANDAKIAAYASANPDITLTNESVDQLLHSNPSVSGMDAHGVRTTYLNAMPQSSGPTWIRTSLAPAEVALSPAQAPLDRISPVEMRRGSDWFMQIFRVDDQVGGRDWISDKKEILGTKMSDILRVETSGTVSVKENTNFNLAQSKNLQEFVSELPKVFPGGKAALSDFLKVRPNISVGEYIARVAKVVPQGTRIGLYTTTN